MFKYIICPHCGSRILFGDSGYIAVAKCGCCNRWYNIYADEIDKEDLLPEEEAPVENVYIWL